MLLYVYMIRINYNKHVPRVQIEHYNKQIIDKYGKQTGKHTDSPPDDKSNKDIPNIANALQGHGIRS